MENKIVTPKPHKLLSLIKTTIEVLLIVAFIFFEELLWKRIAIPIGNAIKRLHFLDKVQDSILEQDKYTILFIFTVLLGITEVLGIYSGIIIVQGAIVFGIFLYLMKAIIAGFTFWIFSFAKVELLTIGWFNTLYGLLMSFLKYITTNDIYIKTKERIFKVKNYIKSIKSKNGFKSKYEGLKKVFKEHPEEEEILNEEKKTDKKKKKSSNKENKKQKQGEK